MAVSLRTYPLGLLRTGASLRGAAGWGEQVSISGGTVGFVRRLHAVYTVRSGRPTYGNVLPLVCRVRQPIPIHITHLNHMRVAALSRPGGSGCRCTNQPIPPPDLSSSPTFTVGSNFPLFILVGTRGFGDTNHPSPSHQLRERWVTRKFGTFT